MDAVRNTLYLGLLVLTPLAVGGVHAEVALVVAAVGLSLVGWETWSDSRDHVVVSVPSLAFWLAALVCLVQIVPLPGSVVSVLNPRAAELLGEGWVAMFGTSTDTAWQTLSLGPARTAGWGARWLALGSVAALTIRRANRGKAVRNVLRAIVVGGLLVLLGGAIQTFAGAERILFLYEPGALVRPYTTFVSSNHAAVFCFFSGFAGFALAVQTGRTKLKESIGAAIAGLVLVGAGFQYPSTASVVALFAMVAVFVVLMIGRDPEADTRYSSYVLYAVLAGLGFVTALFVFQMFGLFPDSAGEWLTELFPVLSWEEWKGDLAVRLELVRAGFATLPDFWRMGAGGGATEYVLSPYIDWSQVRPATVPTVENEPLEWLIHYGVFLAPAIGLLLISYFVFAVLRYRSRQRLHYVVGVSVALFAVIIAQFHFPLTALGIAIPIVCLLEVALFPMRRGERDRGLSRKTVLRRGVLVVPVSVARWTFALAVGSLAVFGVVSQIWAVDAQETSSDSVTTDDLRKWVSLTPSDGDIYAVGASRSLERGETKAAIRRAEHAFEVEPKANMSIRLARTYRKAGRTEKAVETYRRTFSDQFDRGATDWVSEILVPDLKRPELVARALADGDEHEWRAAARKIRDVRGPSSAASFAMELVKLAPDRPKAYEIAIRNYLRMDQLVLAEMWARRLVDRNLENSDGDRPAGYDLLVRALERRGRLGEARSVAVEAVEKLPESEDVALRAVSVLTEKSKDATEEEFETVAQAMPLVCRHRGKPWRKNLCWRTEGWLAEQRGNLKEAGYAYRRIARKLEGPREYLSFLVRHGRCDELSEFLAERESSSDEDFSNYLGRCRGD